MHKGPVFIVDDDSDEHDLIKDIWKELNLPNEIKFFGLGQELIDHLLTIKTAPFIIISDVNLPKMNGFELRERILNHDSKIFNSVPFIFWSTKASDAQIAKAFDLAAHGFFIKESSIEEIKKSFTAIIDYWQRSEVPTKK